MSGIYIHIPFCKQACNYCDFHFSTNLGLKQQLVRCILKEITLRNSYLNEKKLNSIYFGGGTPSLLSELELTEIFTCLKKHFVWDKHIEITLEANPDDITEQNLRIWKNVGINRLSIGLQSFSNEELKWMNRAHLGEESINSVKMAQDHGFNNISIDLIYGSKFQTLKNWEQTLQKAIDLKTQHISSYNLTIENKTLLGTNYKKGKEPNVNDELSSEQFYIMTKMLSTHEFIHYEISNFGKDGFFAQHNSAYWKQQNYLGLGPSAHSYNGHSRQWNVKNNSLYIKQLNESSLFFEKEELSVQDKYNEYILTRLRTIWGCNAEEIKQVFGEHIHQHFLNAILQHTHFIENHNGTYTLNNAGKLKADGIASDLFID